jgi:hypothetical protein
LELGTCVLLCFLEYLFAIHGHGYLWFEVDYWAARNMNAFWIGLIYNSWKYVVGYRRLVFFLFVWLCLNLNAIKLEFGFQDTLNGFNLHSMDFASFVSVSVFFFFFYFFF